MRYFGKKRVFRLQ